MNSYRQERLAHSIMRELATAIAQDMVQDPRVSTLATIYHVHLSSDLSQATVRVGGMLNQRALHRSVAGLNSARGFLQHYINQRLRLRRVPRLKFVLHTTLKENFKIAQRLGWHHERISSP